MRASENLALNYSNLECDGFLIRFMTADVRLDFDSVCLPNVRRRLKLRNEDLDPSLCLISGHEPWQFLWRSPRALLPLSNDDQLALAVDPTCRPGQRIKVRLDLF